MPSVPVKTKSVKKSLYKNYLEKTEEFLAAMRDAYREREDVKKNSKRVSIRSHDERPSFYQGINFPLKEKGGG